MKEANFKKLINDRFRTTSLVFQIFRRYINAFKHLDTFLIIFSGHCSVLDVNIEKLCTPKCHYEYDMKNYPTYESPWFRYRERRRRKNFDFHFIHNFITATETADLLKLLDYIFEALQPNRQKKFFKLGISENFVEVVRA